MADGAGASSKLDKLARLRNLKSGLKAVEASSEDDDDTSVLDSMLADDEAQDAPEAASPAPKAPAPTRAKPAIPGDVRSDATPAPKPAPAPGKRAEPDADSLSSYFEALGIVPDQADGAPRPAPKPFTSSDETYARASGKRATAENPGRDVDERDLWADPVRSDDTFVNSFATGAKPEAGTKAPEPEDEDDLSLDSIIGSLEDDESPGTKPSEAAPEFDSPVDIEAFEAEIALSAQEEEAVAAPDEPTAAKGDQPLTITFDDSRATLLAHVSKQMGCSIDDVVVTAIDWYLDALFGEEDPEVAAQAE